MQIKDEARSRQREKKIDFEIKDGMQRMYLKFNYSILLHIIRIIKLQNMKTRKKKKKLKIVKF